jgi:predicted SAM-dependent methyltransferase
MQGGFNDIASTDAFYLIVAVNSSFSHLLTGAERADAFRRMFRALIPSGIILLDVPNFLWILKHYRPGPMEQCRVMDGQTIRLSRQHVIDFHDATFTTLEEYIMMDVEHEEVKVAKQHVYAMTSFPELAYLLAEAGFSELRTYNTYASRQSERLTGTRIMLSAQKPG